MMTYSWMSGLVVELLAYTSLVALHAIRGEADALSYGLLVLAVSLRIYRRFRRNRKNRSDSHDPMKD
jgi:hypothetical protein